MSPDSDLPKTGLKRAFHSFFPNFKRDPFKAIDGVDWSWRWFQFNILRDDVKLRKAFLGVKWWHGIPIPHGIIVFAMIGWVICGFDGSITQIDNFLINLPNFVLGQITWNEWVQCFFEPYGKFMHWSAIVIYGLMFYGLSKHLREKLGMVNSLNLSFAICFTCLAIGVFELFWMCSYYIFQDQTWILTFKWPQVRIIVQNVFVAIGVGILALYALDWGKVKINYDILTYELLLTTLGLILLWWTYGVAYPVQQIAVEVEGYGTWVSSKYFPQTVYTVDTNILDNVAMGTQFYVQNDLLHLINVLTKVFMALFFYNLFKLEWREKS